MCYNIISNATIIIIIIIIMMIPLNLYIYIYIYMAHQPLWQDVWHPLH